jgi:predicted DCC family thiol-disulfide oxidoreductase YuxK
MADRMNTTSAHRAGSGARFREQSPSDGTGDILVVYDRQCPACDTYCRFVRVSPSAGSLRLVDARQATGVMKEITDAGLDIDQGMVVKMGGQLYYGSDAIHTLALLSTRSGLFNRLNHYVFRSQTLSRILYPALRACRNLLLKALRKTKINNLGIERNDRF